MKYSVIIPTCHRAGLLSETLDSLACQTSEEFEVIVVCDGEDAKTRALSGSYSAKFRLTWIFLIENQGPPAARNRGVNEARGEILLFLDDDTPAAPNWLFHHTKHHDAHGGGGIVVCGQVIETYARLPRSNTERFLRKDRERILKGKGPALSRLGADFDLYVVCGLNCSIRRNTFLKSGGFDPALREIDDMELGTRLNSQGSQFLYEPRSIVYHRSTKDLEEHYVRSNRVDGAAAAYRLRTKNQRNAQMWPLAQLHHGNFVSRFKQRTAWRHPDTVKGLAHLWHCLTEAMGSEFFFRRWRNYTSAARYWEGVRQTGLTNNELRRLVGWPLRVLAFHSISVPQNPNESKYSLSPQRFERFMEWLRVAQFRCVTPLECLSGNEIARSVCLTFDDGYEDFYFKVFPKVESLHLKPTVFVVVDQIGKSNSWDEGEGGYRKRRLLNVAQIREMHRYGVQFGSHTLTHPWLPDLPDPDLHREVTDSKSRLEDLLGSDVSCFAYPAGGVDARVRSVVAAAGYKAAMTVKRGLTFWQDPMCLNRIEVSERDTLLDLVLKVETSRSIVRELDEELLRLAQGGLKLLPSPIAHVVRRSVRTLGILGSRQTQ